MADVIIKPIRRLLVANRSEIARRIVRTARKMGKFTISVYADVDANEPFVKESDLAIALSGRTSRDTYLNIDKVLHACKVSRADAVHPGYGFLSENPEFAEAVINEGITWVGPPAEAIRKMGDKLEAKALMEEAGVPTLPSHEISSGDDYAATAAGIGYPVLVKAAAGGGGKGMRVVEHESELASAIESARREAASAFGDDTVFLERWLSVSRHVEIQIMGDQYGKVLHYFERECSIQRRHQKIIEEAPSPAVDDELRKTMGQAAVVAAQKLNYASAGTVEFLLDRHNFWFLEVNTRLQVEHPVTEEITGRDLVHEQILIAEGEPITWSQEDVTSSGHAIEARLYAEDANNNFLPSPGSVVIWEPAIADGDVRVDSGIESGSEVSMEFDPMIAKVIAFGDTRRSAIEKLARSLETTRIAGITTNRDFLVAALRAPEFLSGDTTTDFIKRVAPDSGADLSGQDQIDAAIAATMQAQHLRRESARVLGNISSGWRNSHMPPESVSFRVGANEIYVEYRSQRDGTFDFNIDGVPFLVRMETLGTNQIWLTVNERRMKFDLQNREHTWYTHGPTGDVELEEVPRFEEYTVSDLSGGLIAPMPGMVIATEVSVGDSVEAGQVLVVLEAMKMEHRITAPSAGTITSVNVAAGKQVQKDVVLLEMDLVQD